MRKLPFDFIDQVCRANDIVDIIGEDTFLKPGGGGYMGLCPFPSHNEKTPSFSVSQRKQVYHCFGCGESGNIITYMQVRRGFHFMEAVKYLAQRAGLPLPKSKESAEEDKQYKERQKMLDLNEKTCAFYEKTLKALPASHFVCQYLQQRGFSEDTVKTFRIGYAEARWDGLYSYLKKEDPDAVEWALKLGLIKEKEGRRYDQFRGRLMFPVMDRNGRDVLGFGGRLLKEEDNQAKYINSTDSPLFHKGHTFYGWQKSAPFIRDSGKALIVEGYTDYLSLYQAGFRNMVATLGTALTKKHAFWLSRHAEQVILFFDGDSAGEKATKNSLSVLLAEGLTVKALKLEPGQDPDSFVRQKGKQVLEQKINSAEDLFLDFLFGELKKHPLGVDRLSLVEKMADILAPIGKATLRNYYQDRLLDSFGLNNKTVLPILNRARKKYINSAYAKDRAQDQLKDKSQALSPQLIKDTDEKADKNKTQQQKVSLREASRSEMALLMLALDSPDSYKTVMGNKVMDKLNHGGVIRMFKAMEEHYTQNGWDFNLLHSVLMDMLGDTESVDRLKKSRYPELPGLTKQKMSIFIQDCLKKVEKEKRQAHLKSLTTYIRANSKNTNKYITEIAKLSKNSPRL